MGTAGTRARVRWELGGCPQLLLWLLGQRWDLGRLAVTSDLALIASDRGGTFVFLSLALKAVCVFEAAEKPPLYFCRFFFFLRPRVAWNSSGMQHPGWANSLMG